LFIASKSIADSGSIASVGSAIDIKTVYHQSLLFSAHIQSSKSKLLISSIVIHSTLTLLGELSLIHSLNIFSACFLAFIEYQFGS